MKRQTMRKLFYLSAFVMGGCIISNGSGKKGDYTKLPPEGKTIDIKPFKAIKADGVFNIILSQGTTEGVLVKGDYPKDLKVSNIGDTLVIEDTGTNHNSHFNISTDIYITLKDINYLENSSVGKTKCADTLKLKTFTFQSEGVGALTLWLNADTIKGSEDGVGSMNLYGRATYADISDNGVGSLDGDDFKVEVLHVNVNGVGAASVYASREIYMQSNGVGGVKYHGPAKVMQSENNGVGSIKHGE
jgi:hypothetical protein